MRTKRAIYNNLAAAIFQGTILFFGLLLPRMIIGSYGSDLNGLVSSAKQIVSYLKYLEVGMTSALIYTLYRPVALRDFSEINPLVTRAKKEYQKISIGYFIGSIIIALIYPLLLKDNLEYPLVAIIVLMVGLLGAFDFLTLSKYRVLLESDQRAYIINITSTVTVVLQNITSIILILLQQSIVFVVLIPIIFIPLRSLLLKKYIKKNYKAIDYTEKPSSINLDSRRDAFISGISDSLSISLPIVIISMIVSLEMASVYSIYSMIFIGLSSIVSIFVAGMSASFGNLFARMEDSNIIKINDYYIFLLFLLLSFLYSTALNLTIPFISVYINDVSDIEYVYPILAALFTLWGVFHNAKIPSQTIINASGNWKIMTKVNIIQSLLLITLILVLGYYWGVNGILWGMIVSTVFRTIAYILASDKILQKANSWWTLNRLIRIFIVITITSAPFWLRLIVLTPVNFLNWITDALIVSSWSLLITISINLIFDWKITREIYNRYIKKFIKKR